MFQRTTETCHVLPNSWFTIVLLPRPIYTYRAKKLPINKQRKTQNPFSETNIPSSGQEIPRFSWYLKVYNRVHKILPMVASSQTHPVHTLISCSLSFRTSTKILFFSTFHVSYIPRPSHPL